MKTLHLYLRVFAVAAVLVALTTPARAQNWSGDARKIAMGGVGASENLASKSIERDDHYRTIVIPFGLFQILRDTDIFDPSSDKFDIVRSFEYAAAPLHYQFNRDDAVGIQFISDFRNAEVSRDLNTYRGFVPVTQPVAYGLAHPNFGVTIPVYKTDRVRHGIYVGAGPYFTMRGALAVDPNLVDILGSETDVAIPGNTSFPILSSTRGELAAALTGGYRGKFAWPTKINSRADKDGIFVAVNYSYLRGFHLEDGQIATRLDTNANGLLIVNSALPPPIIVNRTTSEEGHGHVVDLGVAGLLNRWEFGFGVNGIGNQIKWTDVENTTYSLSNLFLGGDFVDSPTVPVSDVTIKQPVQYTGNGGYHAEHWTVAGQITERTSDYAPDEGHLSTTTIHLGGEYRFLILEPRGGVYYSRDRWQPAGGIGLNFGKIGFDFAMYSTDANVQRERHAAMAFSLRIGHKNP